MSYVTLRYLYCDGPLCGKGSECFTEGVGHEDTITEQRRYARTCGWRYINGIDYCPNCYKHAFAPIKEKP